jgi:hypothetical protein
MSVAFLVATPNNQPGPFVSSNPSQPSELIVRKNNGRTTQRKLIERKKYPIIKSKRKAVEKEGE